MTKEENFIKKYKIGKDSRLVFDHDTRTFFVKDIHPDRKRVFAKASDGVLRCKRISNIIKVDGKEAVFINFN